MQGMGGGSFAPPFFPRPPTATKGFQLIELPRLSLCLVFIHVIAQASIFISTSYLQFYTCSGYDFLLLPIPYDVPKCLEFCQLPTLIS